MTDFCHFSAIYKARNAYLCFSKAIEGANSLHIFSIFMQRAAACPACSVSSNGQFGMNSAIQCPKGQKGLLRQKARKGKKQLLWLVPVVQRDSEKLRATWISLRNLKVQVIIHVLLYILLRLMHFFAKQMNLCSRFTQRHNDLCQPDTDEHSEHQ